VFDDGSAIEGGSAESMEIELEKGKMIPGFIEGVIGMEINDTKLLKCQFPEDYQQKEACGRKAEFHISLQDLKTKELPELNDDFAKQASDKDTLAELRSDLEKRLKEDVSNRQIKNRQDSLLNALVKELEVELPKSLIDQEVRVKVEQTAQNFAQQGIDVKTMFTPEIVKSLMESSREDAEKNVNKKLALNALAKSEKIEVTEDEIKSKFKEVQDELKRSKDKSISPDQLRQAIADDLLQEKLYLWLEENNIVNEKPPTVKDKTKKDTKKTTTSSKKKMNKDEKETKSSKSAKDIIFLAVNHLQ
jgi:trigger factor